MKPIISYYGGKQRMASKIVPLLFPHTVYAEPFCGGASVLFAKGKSPVKNNNHCREIINDTSGLLINLYRVIQEQPEEFFRRIEFTLYSEAEHRKAIEICKNPEGKTDMEKAWAYYVNIEQSFSNVLNGGWKRGVFRRNHSATWRNKTCELKEKISRFSTVAIANTDALKFIKQFDSPQTCFYIDPPYPNANMGHYSGYTIEDFKNLVELLDTIQGSFVLSNYDQPEINFPKDWERFEFSAHCSASRKGLVNADRTKKATDMGDRKRTEIIWRRPAKAKVREELKGKLWCPATGFEVAL